ncbi:MAG: thioredoxin domain-containing protein, partial [Planctomycetota bacterium]
MRTSRRVCLAMLAALLMCSCSARGDDTGSGHIHQPATSMTDTPAIPAVADIRRDGNRLKHQPSVYLRQHAHNPIDWYPWGDEALQRAAREDKPVFLSVGYSSCHWCHVMEHEVFEKDDVAEFLNAHFVCIKLDREERPDLDRVYMDALVSASGSGGWPMSLFLTTDLKPFMVGTYIPYPQFLQAAQNVATMWREKRDDVEANATELSEHVSGRLDLANLAKAAGLEADEPFPADEFNRVALSEAQSFDFAYGGSGSQKFPSTPTWQYLLHWYRRSGDSGDVPLGKMLRLTLDHMANGGLYDHIGGGFHRYTVERAWILPHFEKMLYDNALLAQLYAEASVVMAASASANADPIDRLRAARYAEIARDTLDYLIRDMSGEPGDTTPGGPFWASYDADSGGEEGSFYVWTPDEISEVAGGDGPALAALLGVKPRGNLPPQHVHDASLRGKSMIMRRMSAKDVAGEFMKSEEQVAGLFAKHREALRAFREKRTWPGLDRKVVTAWNALAISAFARGYQAFGEPRYRMAAESAAEWLWSHHRRESDGRLWRASTSAAAGETVDSAPTGDGIVEDYACLAEALLDLYDATGAEQHLSRALELVAQLRDHFAHDGGGFWHTREDVPTPMGRQQDLFDNATPSGNGVGLRVLLRAAAISGNEQWHAEVERSVSAFAGLMLRGPMGTVTLYDTALWLHAPWREVVIAADDADDNPLLAVLRASQPTWISILRVPAAGPSGAMLALAPPLAGKVAIDGK